MATIKSSLGLQDKMSPAFSAINKAMNSTLSAIASIKGANLGPEFAQAAADVKLAQSAIEQMNNELQETPAATAKAGNGYTTMKGLAVNALSAIAREIKNSVRGVIALTDELTNSSARLASIAGEGETVAEIQNYIFRAAQRSRGEYMGMLDTVSKLRMQAPEAFASTEEAIYFAEQLNKQFTISGTSASGIESVMYNLTQALSSGVLRGQDLNAVFSNAPSLVRAIADYLEVPIGSIRSMAAEGELSADVIKNALFLAADETDARFAQMPMTIGQIWQAASNNILLAAQPLLEGIAKGAQYIYDNWSKIEPIVVGIAGALGIAAVAWGIYTAVTWLSVAANQAFIVSLMTNPIVLLIAVIAIIIAKVYEWVKAVGGIKIAWAIVQDYLLWAWDNIKIAFFNVVYWCLNLGDKLNLGMSKMAMSIANFMGDTKVFVLNILQSMVNGAIDIINDFINMLNKIPGVSIEAVEHVTFAAESAAENEAKKQARAEDYMQKERDAIVAKATRETDITRMKSEAAAATAERQANISAMQEAAQASTETAELLDSVTTSSASGAGSSSGAALKTTGEVNIASEDIKMLLDIATRERQITYQTLTPQLALNVETIRETADLDQIVEYLAAEVEEMAEASLVEG